MCCLEAPSFKLFLYFAYRQVEYRPISCRFHSFHFPTYIFNIFKCILFLHYCHFISLFIIYLSFSFYVFEFYSAYWVMLKISKFCVGITVLRLQCIDKDKAGRFVLHTLQLRPKMVCKTLECHKMVNVSSQSEVVQGFPVRVSSYSNHY